MLWENYILISEHRASNLEYHFCKDQKKPHISAEYLRESCGKFLPQNFEIHLVIWTKKFHPRYVLTDVGGIAFEHGLDTGGNDTDVSLLDPKKHEKRWREFQLEEYQNETDKPFESIWVKS